MRDSHTDNTPFQKIHRPISSSIRSLTRGRFGALIPEARTYLKLIRSTCVRCFEQDGYLYDQEMGQVFTRAHYFNYPFQHVSVDPLGPVEVKLFSKSRRTTKIYPLVIRCLDTGALAGVEIVKLKEDDKS